MSRKITKEDIIKEFKKLVQDFQLKYGTNNITRDQYRRLSKFNHHYEKFMTFNELKQTYSVDLPSKKYSKKRFVISSILPNSRVDEDFVDALKKSPNIRQALISLGLTPKGGNYARANELIQKYQIEKFFVGAPR